VQNDVPPAHKIPWNLPCHCHAHHWCHHLDSHSVETVGSSLVFHSPCLYINLQPQDIMPAKSVMLNVMSLILPSEVLIFRHTNFVILQSITQFSSPLFLCVKALCMLEKSVYSSPTLPLACSFHVPFSGFEMNQKCLSAASVICSFMYFITFNLKYCSTNTMEQSPPWEANSSLASEGISHILWILKVHYHVH